MSPTAEALKTQLIELPVDDRAELAEFLWQSLDDEESARAAWDTELARREEEIRSGKAGGEPAAQVFAELREKYS